MKFQRILSHLLSLPLVLVMSGCATGARFTNPKGCPSDTALLYVFRPSSPPYLLKPTIVVNGTKAAKLTNKGYFDLELKPGSYVIKADWSWNSSVPDREVLLQAEKGQTYYLVVGADMNTSRFTVMVSPVTVVPVTKFESVIALVDGDAALAKIIQCGLVEKHPGIGDLIIPK
jgi:hypothetical protein